MSKRKPESALATRSSTSRVLLALLKLPGMGRKTVIRLLNGQDHVDSLESLLQRQSSNDYTSSQIEQAYAYADETLERSHRQGIRILSVFDSDFPLPLKMIDDRPLLLHVKGALEALHSALAVAIIGTREPTKFGETIARKIANGVAEKATVVSGLAKGCDAAAHWGCLEAKGKTVAVLAHGLDKVYPAENKQLAEEILSTSGCLVSEYEVGQRPFRTNFIDRDRLQSGLSRAVILVESAIIGGSMHTIKFAQQQHRVIACVKHPPALTSEEKVQGNRKLLEEGKAIPLESFEDVDMLLEKLRHLDEEETQPVPATSIQPGQLKMF